MKRIYSFLVILLILGGCSATKVISFYVEDESNIDFSTFSFYKRETGKLNKEQLQLDSLLETTIANKLIEKGYKKAYPSDVYISFQITTGSTSSSQMNNPYYGSRRYYPYYNYNVSVTQYKEGVLLVELRNNDDKLIWQGSKTFKVRSSNEIKQLLLQNASEIIQAFKSHS